MYKTVFCSLHFHGFVFFWKIMQVNKISEKSCKEKITLQDLAREKLPCKILQGKNFLARSCKEQISLQDLTSNCIFTKILQDPCKERIFSQPGWFKTCIAEDVIT